MNKTVSILVPVFNGESTIIDTLNCIKNIEKKVSEIIIINDNSTDKSLELISNYKFLSKPIIINHQKTIGLASSYNEAINTTKSDIILIIHQDITFKKYSIDKIIEPFNTKNTVAATHKVILPKNIWLKFNFWQRFFFARRVDRIDMGMDGKFDAFDVDTIKKVGLFDSQHFRSAGEDGDIIYKLNKVGKIIQTEALIIHIHSKNPKFSAIDIYRKQAQYSEAQGVLLRLGRINNIKMFAKAFFREILAITLLVPVLNKITIIPILIYAVYYSHPMFTAQKINIKTLFVPLFNIIIMYINLIYSTTGFIKGKQTI